MPVDENQQAFVARRKNWVAQRIGVTMKALLTISELENAINRFKRAHSLLDYTLPADLRLMATLYGRMIYQRLTSYDLALESTTTQQVVERWIEPDVSHDSYDDTRKLL